MVYYRSGVHRSGGRFCDGSTALVRRLFLKAHEMRQRARCVLRTCDSTAALAPPDSAAA